MKECIALLFCLAGLVSCRGNTDAPSRAAAPTADTAVRKSPEKIPYRFDPAKVVIEKALSYDKHTLADTYPYRDTVRMFKWDTVRTRLALVDSLNSLKDARWGVLQNYRNRNGEAPLVKVFRRDAYKRVADTLGVERYQSVPLFLPGDLSSPERYGRDGSLVRLLSDGGDSLLLVDPVGVGGRWIVPTRYVRQLPDTVAFGKVVVVDRTDQNIATLERVDGKWLVRSMNPATTGVHRPPYAQETPKGMFVLQEKKQKMIFLKDGSVETGGYAPYASRFTNGGYIHGVPVNEPRTAMIEFSPSLGTTPRSHMCVRNATSHAKFVYDWAPVDETLIFVID